MRIIRYQYGNDIPRYGWLYQGKVGLIEGSIFAEYRRMEANIPIDQVRILTPVTPGKVIGILHNYAEHAVASGEEVPDLPRIFYKPPSSLIRSGGKIVLPPQSKLVEHEANLALVVGKKGRWINLNEALSYVLGFTIANDVTAKDLIRRDNGLERSKGFDSFCPVGPWIDTEVEPADLMISCRVNDELRQMLSTREMIFSIPQLLVYVSSIMTLIPGDMILTGSPGGTSQIYPGDEIEISIEGIGTLVNQVVSEDRTGKY